MKNIYLIRHGEAENFQPNVQDIERTLTAKGETQFAEKIALAKKHLPMIEKVFISPATRTQQTADIMNEQWFHNKAIIQIEDFLYQADYQMIYRFLQMIDNQYTTVAVIGHNPALSILANFLTEDNIRLNPGDLYAIAFNIDDWQALFCHTGKCLGYFDENL